MEEKLLNLKEESKIKINDCSNLNLLNDLKIELLGKKGILTSFMSKLSELPANEKAEAGKKINDIKSYIIELIDNKKEELEVKELTQKLTAESIDVTLPGDNFNPGTLHIINKIIDEISEICIGLGFNIAEGPEVETDYFNFEMLNLPKDHPARDMQDSFYLSDSTLLRTHTSPVQARTLQQCNGQGPVRIICPGRVYRRDEDDATHSHQFNQIEGLVVDKNITMADLKGTLSMIVKKMFGQKRVIRFRSSFFPFTEPSVEVDVSCANCEGKGCNICKNTGWIEVLGAGMVHPNVLQMNGFDPLIYQGYAFGMGADRIAMLRYGINDIRHLYSNDVRILRQFIKER